MPVHAELNRRTFVQMGLAACATSLCASPLTAAEAPQEQTSHCVFTTCLACNARCGAKVTVDGQGHLAAIAGNPYHPYCMGARPLAPESPLSTALETPAPVCGKAHEVAHATYDPYRLRRPLKRAGKRGEGKFEPIAWETLIREVSEGGELFAHLGDHTHYPGFRDLLSDEPIDPKAPELGSKRNGLVFIGGRDQAGYQHFTTRFVRDAIGSVNRISHTDICGLGFRMGNYAATLGKDVELKADPVSCEYLLIFGANVYEALQPGINHYGALLASGHAEKRLSFTVVDPRATHASCHADHWLAITPGQDGALALAMIRLMFEEKRYNATFLEAYNADLAKKAGYVGFSNACHLVITEPKHPDFGRFLRRSHVEGGDPNSPEGAACMVQSLEGAKIISATSNERASLFANPVVLLANGQKVQCASALFLLREEALAHTLEDYATRAGLTLDAIRTVTKEFTSHGTKAAVCQYHGCGNYIGGTQASYAVALLNVLIGSVNKKGGYLHSGGNAGAWNKGLYDLTLVPGKPKASGVKISREGAVYEQSSEYREKKAATGSGYPAKRPWFSFTRGGLCVEAMNGIDQSYPYACTILCTFFFNPVYSIPGGTRYCETLANQKKVPLHISLDICVNESNVYADYIVPDLSWLEGKYAFMGPHAPALKFTTVRIPAIEPLTEKTADGRPMSSETFLIDVAEYLHLPGFGQNALQAKDGSLHPLHKAEDFYLPALANIAHNAKVPAATAEEMRLVEKNTAFARHKNCVRPEEWPFVCKVAARGGVFPYTYEALFTGDSHTYGLPEWAIYNEKMATSRNAITGQRFRGTPCLAEACFGNGTAIPDEKYPFTAVTYKMHVHAQSRSISHAAALERFPENFAHIHKEDAQKLGIREGDLVRLISHSCPKGVVVKAHVTELIRPGCVALSFHYGHTQMGASPLTVANAADVFLGGTAVCATATTLRPDPARGRGASFNALGRLDPTLANLPLVDALGGIPDFSSTRVQIVKA